MTIDIPEDVALQLEALAKQKNADIGDLLREMLARYAQDADANDKPWATLADLARNAKEAELASPHPVDTSARSREILNTEYVDYLLERHSST